MSNRNGHIHEVARIFRILGDPTRLRILLELQGGQQNVGQLCRKLSIAQPTVSHHLALLRMGELVAARRSGKEIFYSIYDAENHPRAESVRTLLKKSGLRFGPLAIAEA